MNKERYQIISTLAGGGYSTVYQAWDKNEAKDVAIKQLKADGPQAEWLVREVRALYSVRHPNIVTMLDYGKDDQGAYLVMEFIKGETLEHRVAQAPLSLEHFKILVTQTLDAIGTAHDAGMIHRDLKPENIMLPWTRDGSFQTKLVDFGLSQAVPPEGAPQDSQTGSIHFMAPEQFGSGHVDFRTDLYSLGCVYYYALTGHLPFPGEEKIQVITAHLYPPKVPLGELRPDLTDELCAWVESLLAMQPAARPATAAAALAHFNYISNHLHVQSASLVAEEPSAVMILEEDEMPAVLLADDEEEPAALLTTEEAAEEELAAAMVEDEPEAEQTAAFASEPPAPAYHEAEPEPEIEPETEAEVADSYQLPPAPIAPAPQPEYVFESGATTAPLVAEPGNQTTPLVAVAAGGTVPLVPDFQEPETGYHKSHVAPRNHRSEPDAPTSRSHAKSSASRGGSGGGSSVMNIIITFFVLVLVAEFGVISYFKYAGRGDRLERLAELESSADPQGSDVDVRMLLEFLQDPEQQAKATKALARLQGGDYIDDILLEHLEKIKNFPACSRLLQIIGERRSSGAFSVLLPYLKDTRGEVRKAAWTALGRIATDKQLPELLAQVPASNASDREIIEKALTANVQASADSKAATAQVVKAYKGAKDSADTRALLFNVLTRVGGDETLSIVSEAIADPAEKVRLAAIMVLAEYPTHEPLATIVQRFPNEPHETCRVYLLLAAREIIGNPGPNSQQALFQYAQNLYTHARDTAEKRYVLSVLSRIISPGTAKFFEDFAQSADANLRQEAKGLARAFREKLEKVVTVPPDAKATLPADLADFRLGGPLAVEGKAIVNWTEDGEWASWLVELPSNGEYEVAIYQANKDQATGTYEVLMAGQTVLTASVKTAGPKDYKGFVVGNFNISTPGIYRLRVRSKTIPSGGELFHLQKLVVKKL